MVKTLTTAEQLMLARLTLRRIRALWDVSEKAEDRLAEWDAVVEIDCLAEEALAALEGGDGAAGGE